MTQAAHESVDRGPGAGLGGILLQPIAEGRIQSRVPRPGHDPGLLDETPVGAQGNVFHTGKVYTILV